MYGLKGMDDNPLTGKQLPPYAQVRPFDSTPDNGDGDRRPPRQLPQGGVEQQDAVRSQAQIQVDMTVSFDVMSIRAYFTGITRLY